MSPKVHRISLILNAEHSSHIGSSRHPGLWRRENGPDSDYTGKGVADEYGYRDVRRGLLLGSAGGVRQVEGVAQTTVGYTGGKTEKPTYDDVCSDATGHAEAVQVVFDPNVVTYEQLLDNFLSMHDPTTLNRQGPDFGSQYRSAIFFHSPEQQAAAVA